VTFIAVICPVDNGGQGIALNNALNKYTEYESRCLTIETTYLKYETDLLYTDYSNLELRSLLRDVDFFIFSEYIPRKTMEKIGLFSKINKNNTIIRVGGTFCRRRVSDYLMMWLREGYMFAGGFHDWTLYGRIGRIAPTANILPIEKMPEPDPPDDRIRVAFSPTKHEKGVSVFSRVLDTLTSEYPDLVEAVPITGVPWHRSVEIKSTCNVTFDQFLIPTYANSAIESMYLRHAVISRIDLWTKAVYPDLPIVSVSDERGLYLAIKHLVANQDEIAELGKLGREFVLRHHTPEVVVKTWKVLIEHVKTAQL